MITRHLALGVAASALLFAAQANAVPNAGTIEGVVKNAAGQPVSGAYVKLKNTDRPPRLGPESLRLVERCRPADSLNCYLLAPSADRG